MNYIKDGITSKRLKSPKSALPFVTIFLLFGSCVAPFDADFTIEEAILIIDGNLTDEIGDNYVSLNKSVPLSETSSFLLPVKDALIEVLVDNATRIPLAYSEGGIYDFPEGFVAEVGHSYKLNIKLIDGRVYSSNEQRIKNAPLITKVYQEFVRDGITHGAGTVAGHKIYLDTTDPVGKGDAYYWTWTLYEFQEYCKSCKGGYYYRNSPAGECIADFSLTRNNITYDYQCEENCWQILSSKKLNAMNDAFVDGKGIEGRLVAEIPHYTPYGAVIELKQHSIDDEAYQFFRLLIDQNQNSGSLADTPSSAFNGNIKNINNPLETIAGYFVVAGVSTYSYFLDRSDVPLDNSRSVGFSTSRQINPEPPGDDPERPPFAPCEVGPFRTNILPKDWRL